MNTRFNAELASRIAAETELYTVAQVAQRNSVARQTVRNHLARELSDPEFGELCRKKRDLLRVEAERQRREWGDATVSCLRALLGTIEAGAKLIRQGIDEKRTLEKGAIRELAGAVKIVAEANLAKTVLFDDGDGAPDQGAEEVQGGARQTGPGEVH